MRGRKTGISVSEPSRAEHFQRVVLPHLRAAFNLARWLCRNDQDAEDIVQEAYLRAFRFFGTFHGEDARAWLLAIVRNTTYTWLRQNRGHELHILFDEETGAAHEGASVTLLNPPDSNPESILARDDDRELLNRALEALPVEFREVLVLRELEDLSYKEISRIARIPMGTVMSRLARARKSLGECLLRMDKESRVGLHGNQEAVARPRR
jgi:RNA polymerase sigma-70 factor (ECF subfamily)